MPVKYIKQANFNFDTAINYVQGLIKSWNATLQKSGGNPIVIKDRNNIEDKAYLAYLVQSLKDSGINKINQIGDYDAGQSADDRGNFLELYTHELVRTETYSNSIRKEIDAKEDQSFLDQVFIWATSNWESLPDMEKSKFLDEYELISTSGIDITKVMQSLDIDQVESWNSLVSEATEIINGQRAQAARVAEQKETVETAAPVVGAYRQVVKAVEANPQVEKARVDAKNKLSETITSLIINIPNLWILDNLKQSSLQLLEDIQSVSKDEYHLTDYQAALNLVNSVRECVLEPANTDKIEAYSKSLEAFQETAISKKEVTVKKVETGKHGSEKAAKVSLGVMATGFLFCVVGAALIITSALHPGGPITAMLGTAFMDIGAKVMAGAGLFATVAGAVGYAVNKPYAVDKTSESRVSLFNRGQELEVRLNDNKNDNNEVNMSPSPKQK